MSNKSRVRGKLYFYHNCWLDNLVGEWLKSPVKGTSINACMYVTGDSTVSAVCMSFAVVVPRPILLNIYNSLIHPYLTYSLAAWGLACKTYLNKIPITFLYFESVSALIHDINNNKAPVNMSNLFQKTSNIHSYNTRSSTSGSFMLKVLCLKYNTTLSLGTE